jgi:hypothetical protein
MLEWLVIFTVKPNNLDFSNEAFRIKPVTDISQEELVVLFTNMIEGRNHGIL